MHPNPNRTTIYILVVCAIAVAMVFTLTGLAKAQDVVVVAEPLPEDITTWGGLIAYWTPKVIQGLLAIIGMALALALRQVVALAPTFVQAYIDSKRQRDLHSAVFSKVSELIREGRWPSTADVRDLGGDLATALRPEVLEEIRGYVVEYNPQSGRWAGLDQWSRRGEALLRTLAARKATEIELPAIGKPDWVAPVIPTTSGGSHG